MSNLINTYIKIQKLHEEGKYKEALSMLLKANDDFPRDVSIYTKIALVYEILAEISHNRQVAELALKWVNKAIELSPENCSLYIHKVAILDYGIGDRNGACDAIREALKINQNYIPAIDLGVLMHESESGFSDIEAIDLLERKILLLDNVDDRFKLGYLYYSEGEVEKAQNHWRLMLCLRDGISEFQLAYINNKI